MLPKRNCAKGARISSKRLREELVRTAVQVDSHSIGIRRHLPVLVIEPTKEPD
jgi:hypothetical protein